MARTFMLKVEVLGGTSLEEDIDVLLDLFKDKQDCDLLSLTEENQPYLNYAPDCDSALPEYTLYYLEDDYDA